MKDIRQGLMASNNLFKEKLFRIKSNIYVRMLQTRVREKRISIGNIQLKMKLRHTNIQLGTFTTKSTGCLFVFFVFKRSRFYCSPL